MAQFTNVQQAINQFSKDVIREARENLQRQNTTGNLRRSLKSFVRQSPNSIQISFEMDEYGFFQDRGVKGTKGGRSLDGYKYTTKMPPPRAFDKWTIRKGIAPRDKTGKFKNRKGLNYAIAKSIYEKGIKPTLFFTRPFERYFRRLPNDLVQKYGLDIEKLFDQITAANLK